MRSEFRAPSRRLSSSSCGTRDVFFLDRFSSSVRSVFLDAIDVAVSRNNGGFSYNTPSLMRAKSLRVDDTPCKDVPSYDVVW